MKMKMKYLFDIYAGATPKSDNPAFWDGNITWITPSDYKTNEKYVSKGSRTITQKGYNSANTTLVPKGSLIVSKRAPIGTVCIAAKPLCTNQGCLSCIPKEGVNSEFFYYVLSAITEEMEILGSGTTFQEISASNFANMKVPYMDLKDQNRITAYLNEKCAAIDEAISRQKKAIEKLEEYKVLYIRDVLYKQGNSKTVRLKYVMDSIKSGDSLANINLSNSGCFDVYGGGKPLGKHNKYNVEDVLIVGRVGANCGCVTDIQGKAWATDNALVIQTPFNKRYMYYVLLNADLRKDDNSTAQPLVTGGKIKSTSVLFSFNKENQRRIAEELDAMCGNVDEAIFRHQQIIEKLEEYKKSLIYNAVTGKIDCRNL